MYLSMSVQRARPYICDVASASTLRNRLDVRSLKVKLAFRYSLGRRSKLATVQLYKRHSEPPQQLAGEASGLQRTRAESR